MFEEQQGKPASCFMGISWRVLIERALLISIRSLVFIQPLGAKQMRAM